MRAIFATFAFVTSTGLAGAQPVAPAAGNNHQPVVEAGSPGAVGIWLPHPVGDYSARSVIIIGNDGRFAALVGLEEEGKGMEGSVDGLNAVSGSWELADDGGELVLTLDNHLSRNVPGATRYLQMLLLGDELLPYPGTEQRFLIAATSWLRSKDEHAEFSETDSTGKP